MSKPMTPEEAREVLVEMIEGRPLIVRTALLSRALETIAGMQEEWGVTAKIGASRIIIRSGAAGSAFDSRGSWFITKEAAERFMESVTATDPRLVRRYVTQVIDDE